MDNKNDLYFVVKWKSQMKKGLLEYIIMVLLQKQDYYGYELISDVKQYVSIEVADGTIYPLLNRLKKEGVVKSEWIQ
ncbi:MAG: PadR family transcriptional regulator, partial [Bacteroidota bacterium]|nr:PadR family transcriptional regulator [Bacteroidota bacterium]